MVDCGAKLERKPSGKLECTSIGAGEAERSEGGGRVYVYTDGVVGRVVAEGYVVGHVLAVNSEDELSAFGDVERTADGAGQAVDVRTAQAIWSDARQIADHIQP